MPLTARIRAVSGRRLELVGPLSTRRCGSRLGSARGAKTLAQVSLLAGGKPSVYASDPEDAYSSLVAWLVNQVTEDLRPHYARR